MSEKLPKFPLTGSLAYSAGAVGYQILDRVLMGVVMFFYLPPAENSNPQLVPIKIFGLLFIFGRVVDSLADPLVSLWTDRSRSPRGRRVPFMLYGGLPLAASLVLMFFPPVKGVSNLNVAWLALFLGLYFFFFTYYLCPYLALLPELARSPRDRINLSSLAGLGMLIGTIIGTVFWAPLVDAFGYRGMALIMGGLAVVFLYMPVLAVDEKKYCESSTCDMGLVESLTTTFKNRPFAIYLFGNVTFWFGFNIISGGITYYITVLLGLPLSQVPKFMAATFGMTILFIPVMNIIVKKIGKRNTMILLLALFGLILPPIYFMDSQSLPISNVLYGYILLGLAGIPVAGLFIVPNAIVADLTDYDEMLTGQRHEAMYFGAQGFCQKVIMGISTYLMTLLFSSFGNSIAEPLGVRLTGPVAGMFAVIGLVAFLFFPRDIEHRVEEFRREKERRVAAEQ